LALTGDGQVYVSSGNE